jgi:hypothetical protein
MRQFQLHKIEELKLEWSAEGTAADEDVRGPVVRLRKDNLGHRRVSASALSTPLADRMGQLIRVKARLILRVRKISASTQP